MTLYKMLPIVFSLLFFVTCKEESNYSENYSPPSFNGLSNARFHVVVPGAGIILVDEKNKQIAVWGLTTQTQWTYLDWNLNLIKDKLVVGKAGDGNTFRGLTDYRVSLNNADKILFGTPWDLKAAGVFLPRKQFYYTGGYNILPGTKHFQNVVLFSGNLQLKYRGNSVLNQSVANMNIEDTIDFSVDSSSRFFTFSYSPHADHYISDVYFIKLPNSRQDSP